MRTIDLNADLGELNDGSLDAAIMPFISSANIACGGHAGSPDSIRRTLRLAKNHGVAAGAHPGYPDRDNFGRISLNLTTEQLCALVDEQLRLFKAIAEEVGVEVCHVKLHGALYNDLAGDYDRSHAVCRTIFEIDPGLRFIGFSGSACLQAAEDAGLVAVHEVFADRTYTEEGVLMSRSLPGAVIHDEADSLAQVEMMVLRQKVPTAGDARLPILADSVCVHGDNPSAVQFAANLRDFFKQQNIAVEPAGSLHFSLVPLGERSLLAKLPSRICKSTHRQVRALHALLDGLAGVRELVPCYSELKIDYDPDVISFVELLDHIESLELHAAALSKVRQVEVPVCYDGQDLKRVAEYNEISEADVVQRHSEQTYLIYMLGFSPGFAYMGGLNASLATPRLETPRISVPAGSVGIAGNQTGIYPVAGPGGWNIIGHTRLKLFDPARENPFLFEPGDEVRFVEVPLGTVEESNGVNVQGGQTGGTVSLLSTAVGRQDGCPSFEVIEPGMYTTVQDGGRRGFLRYGLPPGGAMDRRAFARANALVGNDVRAAVVECTGTMPVLEFSEDVYVSVVYADHETVFEAKAGERISLDPIRSGYRAYVAVAGGIDVPEVMGSRSTYVPAELGGLEGRVLRAGDVLKVGQASSLSVEGRVSATVGRQVTAPADSNFHPALRVIPGPEADWFDCGGLNTFLTEGFTVSSKSDRSGIRLAGVPLSFHSDEQMVSSGLAMGTIQVPPSGLPIIMMADHPTTGGYPRIGCVVEEDLSVLAQLKPGDVVRFAEVLFSNGRPSI